MKKSSFPKLPIEFKPPFGECLRKLRKIRKMTQRQLAMYANLSNTEISRLEKGERRNPSPEILQRLAQALHIPYQDLMKAAGYIADHDEIVDPQLVPYLDKISMLTKDELAIVDAIMNEFIRRKKNQDLEEVAAVE